TAAGSLFSNSAGSLCRLSSPLRAGSAVSADADSAAGPAPLLPDIGPGAYLRDGPAGAGCALVLSGRRRAAAGVSYRDRQSRPMLGLPRRLSGSTPTARPVNPTTCSPAAPHLQIGRAHV